MAENTAGLIIIREETSATVGGQDYNRVTQRLKALNLPDMNLETIGLIDDYPVYRVCLNGDADAPKNILVSAGVHGDEPAGPEAVLCFLERDNTDVLQHFRFYILPCINPYGYVHNQRENRQGVDINRSFAGNDVAEVALVKNAIDGQRFDFFIDLHEDSDVTGFYLYEGQRHEQWMGPQIIREVATIGQIETDSDENDEPIAEGVLKVASAWGDAGLAPYVQHFHSDHVMICETPTHWPLEKRVAVHLKALDTALNMMRTTDKSSRKGTHDVPD